MGKKKDKVSLPPDLPPDVHEDEIEVSDEDLQFVDENRAYAGFVSNLDTKSITRHVRRVADVKEDDLETLYEQRLRKKSAEGKNEEKGVQIDPVDALPVKTLKGELYYRKTVLTTAGREAEASANNEQVGTDKSGVKMTKAEKHAKLKKLRKEAKRQSKEVPDVEETQQTPQVDVLDEVKKDLTAEEANEKKKFRLAELGTALLTDPESNIKFLKEMMQVSKDGDHTTVILGLKSLLAVFKDIIPGYRIRLPTEKEQEMVVSKTVKKMRFYESTLLSVYKAYLQKLMSLEQQAAFQRVAVRCICTLLDSVPHFNFRQSLLAAVIRNIASPDDVIRKLCCTAIKSLFTNEGKHGGEATVEAIRLIADLVKAHDCQLHADSIEVFMSLSFDEDLGRPETVSADSKGKSKKFNKKRKKQGDSSAVPDNERKKSKKDLISKTREEVDADFKAASFSHDIMERRKMQSDALSAVFQTYFRILKHTMYQSGGGHQPLLSPCLNGIGKFSHLIDLDFMGDLMRYLQKLAGSEKLLTVSERLRCCTVAFKVMKNNLDALNVDLQDFFVQLYRLILDYRPGRDDGEVLGEALKIMLCDDRQHDMQRAAAFIKRLATFSLCFGSAESMSALVTLKHLLQKNVKCRNLLENDAGGGSVSGPIAKYDAYASDPNLSGALASVLWELNLLSKHYHPAVSTMASSISSITTNVQNNPVYRSNVSPQQAFLEYSLQKESFNLKSDTKSGNCKRKRGSAGGGGQNVDEVQAAADNQDEAVKKLSDHFSLLHDITENERLRSDLALTTSALLLYKQYKKQKA
jgi:nucleolar complex protein 3